MICGRKGYPVKVVMPENVTAERTQLLRMYGAEIVYSEGSKGSNGAVELALDMAEKDASYYMPYQYGNQANPLAHYNGTALEILEELDEVAAFVAGLGTGGTLMGNGRRLKEELGDEVKIVAAEPMQGEPVQGLRSLEDGFIPPIIDLSLLDRKIFVTNADAIAFTRKLLDEERLFAGVSSGRDRARRRADRRRARRGQRRVHRRRRRMEVPVVRDLHPSGGGDREPGRHRLVVSAETGAATSSRRTILSRSASASQPVPRSRSAGARSKSNRPNVHKIPPAARNADVEILNGLLDREHKAIAAYTAGIPLLDGHVQAAAKQFLSQELTHAGELCGLIKQAGGIANKPQPSYAFGQPRTAARTSSSSCTRSSRPRSPATSRRSRTSRRGRCAPRWRRFSPTTRSTWSCCAARSGSSRFRLAFVTGGRVGTARRDGRPGHSDQASARLGLLLAGGLRQAGVAVAAAGTRQRAPRRPQSRERRPAARRAARGGAARDRRLRGAYRLGAALASARRAPLGGRSRQERAHVRALTARARASSAARCRRARSAPTAVDKALADRHVSGRVTKLRTEHDCVSLLLDLETVVQGVYFKAMSKLQNPGVLRLAAQIMANEAQHATAISEARRPGDIGQAVPYAFVEGRH